MASQDQTDDKGVSDIQTAANRFFRDRDLCTMLCEVLVTQAAFASTGKMCVADQGTNTLLNFRGATRQAWKAVMLESATRRALNLMHRDETTEGILIYLEDPASLPELGGRRPDWPDQFHAFITYNASDVAKLHVLEKEDQLHSVGNSSGVQARIITHHRAAAHEYNEPLMDALLGICAEQLEVCSRLPLAMEMFLTQPPQKSIRFWVSYEYLPGRRHRFDIEKEQGIRLGDLVAHLEREPGLMRQQVNQTQLYPYRRWLRNSEVVNLVEVRWEFKRAIVKGSRFDKNAKWNTQRRLEGEK